MVLLYSGRRAARTWNEQRYEQREKKPGNHKAEKKRRKIENEADLSLKKKESKSYKEEIVSQNLFGQLFTGDFTRFSSLVSKQRRRGGRKYKRSEA
jgi:hypothetical protein